MVIFKISTIYPENDNLLSVKWAELCQFTFPAFESKKSVQKCPMGIVKIFKPLWNESLHSFSMSTFCHTYV